MQQQGKLIGRSKTRSTLGCSHHNRPRVRHQTIDSLFCIHGMRSGTHRASSHVRIQSGHLLKGQPRPRPNHELHAILFREELDSPSRHEVDTVTGKYVTQIDRNVAFRPRPDGHPWIAGGELEGGTVREKRDTIVGVEEMAGVVGR
eukprot:scaffold28929_cov71-Cyclotella_meneghiniana.AAC.18